MDALEFIRERKRMCKSQEACVGCPLERSHCIFSTSTSDEEDEKNIAAVEQWSKEHPRKTRQSVFLEQYPEAYVLEDGYLKMCPMSISAAYRDSNGECNNSTECCVDCRRGFWSQEVE